MGECRIISANSRDDMRLVVERFMRDGWHIQGGVSVLERNTVEYRQAMYRPATHATGEKPVSSYTTEQVIEMEAAIRNCTWPADLGEDMMLVASMLSDYATLRQQAGRVDEGRRALMQEARDQLHSLAGGFVRADQLIARIDAALAQNTQGDGEAVSEDDELAAKRYLRDWVPDSVREYVAKLERHAERARVPDRKGDPDDVPSWVKHCADAAGVSLYIAGWNNCHDAFLAAAPSQRAEVK